MWIIFPLLQEVFTVLLDGGGDLRLCVIHTSITHDCIRQVRILTRMKLKSSAKFASSVLQMSEVQLSDVLSIYSTRAKADSVFDAARYLFILQNTTGLKFDLH